MAHNLQIYAPTILRAVLGPLFIIPGVDKLMGMLGGGHMIAEMLGPALTWVLLLAEIIFGLAVLIGYKVQYTVWPLVIVLIGAIVMVVIPGQAEGWIVSLLFHLLGIAALISVSLTGPGVLAVSQE